MLYTIDAKIWVDAPEGADPEDIAGQFQSGLKSAVEHFPAAEVLKADVQGIDITSKQEILEEGLGE